MYREWRPKTFDDVVGQSHITTTIKNQIITNRIAHAYLFCGTRGTGKTTTARILAKTLNCLNPEDGEPCNKCEMCEKVDKGLSIDVTELDAASNNGVDNIRDIIDDVQYPPQEAKYKIYIMDEVHMLSSGAVNAFLKTLEEPPKNVVFILATTDPQKLPITILSRCQRFDFKRIRSKDVFGRLRAIVEKRGIFSEDKSLELIARVSDGAMRDALSILDQAIAMGKGTVEYENLISMLGLVTNDNLLKLTDMIISKNIEGAIKIIDDIVLSGKDINNFIKEMVIHMRNLMVLKVSNNPKDILDMSLENIELLNDQAQKIRVEELMRNISILQEAEDQSRWGSQGRIYLELAAVKMCKREFDTSKEVLLARINRLEDIIKQGKVTVECERVITKTKNETQKVNEQQGHVMKEEVKPVFTENAESKITLQQVKSAWKDILDTFKARRLMIIYASLVTGKPNGCSNGVIEVLYEAQYAFNKKRLEKDDNSKTVNEVFSDILKEKVRVVYTIEASSKKENSPEESLINSFGEEVVEIIDE
ncbi:DNA polymerase III subunit tau [Clostridium oryzae]|uniref:DNA-directed DNA polymerase n=1 Tax=Clostridium oryzae TaxID=1450648 RepID=A0A1V4IX79_9CLOT|nr:DNA polymerase III subunit tau [Clostridium oryzae]